MRDFYPDDMVLRNRIFDAWRAAASNSGFAEYDACVVESLELLKRKAGEEIVNQIYAFKDKSDRDLALRPEVTPTLARMVAARDGSLSFPIKWATIAQCFRYERTTRGRKREHYQWNLDIVGSDSMAAEAEVIATAIAAMAGMGLTAEHFRVHFNSRALLGDLLVSAGIDADHHAATFLALDKRGKINDEAIKELLTKEGVDHDAIAGIFSILAMRTLDEVADALQADTASLAGVKQFLSYAEAYGIDDLLQFDLSIIRGLAYYTGVVFEAFDTERNFRAIFGGGRYDNLLRDVGGTPRSGVGLGFGDVVIAELLADTGVSSTAIPRRRTRIGFMSDEQQTTAISIATALRSNGTSVTLALGREKAKTFFSRASREGYDEAIYIGPDDLESGTIRIKDMATRDQREVTITDIGGTS
jgi:histidyl-tRNA synthetase